MSYRIKEAIRQGAVDPFFAAKYHGGGKGSAPPAPDYAGAAAADQAGAQRNLTQQTFANRPQMNTPWGQMSWETGAGVDPSTGQTVTNWTGNLNLTPEQQASLDSQQRIGQGRSDAAETLLGQATGAFQTPFGWDNLAAAPKNIEDAQRGAFEKMSAMLQPGRAQQQEALDTKLANMGLSRGGEAFKRAGADLSNNWAQQDKSLLAQSLAEGRADTASQMGLRQQGIAEEAQRRGMPLSELNALLTGQQVNMPQMPGFNAAGVAQAPNSLGAAQAQGQYGMDAAKMKADSGPDIGQLAGSAMGAMAIAGMF